MAGITGFKVALCIAYLRISQHSSLYIYRTFIWCLMAFAILSHLAGTLVLIFQCHPVQKSWLPTTPGSCLPNDITFYALAAVTILCDVAIFVTPIPLLMRLRINPRRKVALIGIFLLGLFTTVCSVMRMVQIIQISKDGNSTGLVLWGTIEMNVGVRSGASNADIKIYYAYASQISLTCLPTLAPLFTFFRSDTAISYRYRSDNSNSKGPRSSKRKSHLAGPLHYLSVGALTGTTTTQRPSRAEIESESSQETILPIQGPNRKSVEDGYILRSVDISVTRQSPGPQDALQSPVPGLQQPPPALHGPPGRAL